MASWRDYLLSEGYEKLAEAKHYTDVLSNDDPEDDPYKSLYLARKNYKAVKKVLTKAADKRNQDEDLNFILASLELLLGTNYVSTEETGAGEEHIQKCLEKLEEEKLTPKAMGIYQEALNQMGILFTGRGKPEEALEYLKNAEILYIEFKNIVGGSPWMVDDFLSHPREDEEKLEFDRCNQMESCYTHTLFYFAQVYQNLGEKGISAQYVHKTLQRQLGSHNFDPLDWSLHAATLSQYYMTERDFSMSRHCLASSEVVFEQAVAGMMNCDADQKEKNDQARADIQRCWVKFGLGLLEYSRERLLVEEAGDNEDDSNTKEESFEQSSEDRSVNSETPVGEEKENGELSHEEHTEVNAGHDKNVNENEKKKGEKFNLEVALYEEKISDQPLKNFDEARVVFLLIKKWIENAKEFYKFDSSCNDYISIVQDHSLSFKFLSFFELDMERQCKMQKRRIDMLTEVLNELNPQHYLLVCRQLMFEIADTYSAMMDLKLAILESSSDRRPTPHIVKKINALVKESIKYYQDYLNSLKGGKPVYPDEFPNNDVRPGLIAMFCIGRLHSKYLVGDVQTRLMNIKKSKDSYQFVVDYCKRNPSAVKLVATELDICKEMVLLLPSKMEKIRRESEL